MSFTCSLFMCSVNFTVLVCVCNSLTSSMAVYILDLHFSYMNISSLRSYDKKSVIVCSSYLLMVQRLAWLLLPQASEMLYLENFKSQLKS